MEPTPVSAPVDKKFSRYQIAGSIACLLFLLFIGLLIASAVIINIQNPDITAAESQYASAGVYPATYAHDLKIFKMWKFFFYFSFIGILLSIASAIVFSKLDHKKAKDKPSQN